MYAKVSPDLLRPAVNSVIQEMQALVEGHQTITQTLITFKRMSRICCAFRRKLRLHRLGYAAQSHNFETNETILNLYIYSKGSEDFIIMVHRENSIGTITVYMGGSNQCSSIRYALTQLICSQNLLEV